MTQDLPKKQSVPMMARSGRGLAWGTLALGSLALAACGSEKDKDRSSVTPPAATPTPKNDSSKGGDADATGRVRKPYVFDSKTPADPETLVCSTPMTLEIELNPSAPSGSQIYLVGRMDPACFDNRVLVVRLRADRGFRLGTAMTCQKVTTGDYNFECAAAPGPFIQGDSIAVPVSVVPGTQANFKAEAEMMASTTP